MHIPSLPLQSPVHNVPRGPSALHNVASHHSACACGNWVANTSSDVVRHLWKLPVPVAMHIADECQFYGACRDSNMLLHMASMLADPALQTHSTCG